jgi:Tol biopolymer transport system component/predicted Ser/Thr protein kinase
VIGRTVSHYRIEEKLGEGGMGVVYRAEDIKLKRPVALKFLSSQLTEDANAIERFEREAQAKAALNHPNIVTIYDVGEFEGQTYISMEYVDGDDLSSEIDAGRVTIERALDVAMQLCYALKQAHDIGIIHRDVKPANVLIAPDGTVKVADFGLAKLRGVSKITVDASTLGTMGFMAPEQLKGETVDHRADIWSLGIVLYHMLASHSPWKGDYDQAVAYEVVNESHRPLKEIKPDVPEQLQEIVEKALAKDPDDRYPNIDALSKDLSSAATSLGIEISAPKARPDMPATASRRRLYVVSAIALVLVVIAAAYIRHWIAGDARQPVYVVPTSSTPRVSRVELKQVTFSSGLEAYPSMSPDGSRVAFSSEVGRFKQIVIKDLQSQEEIQVTDTDSDNIQPAWSPDGKTLLFVRSHAAGGKLEPGDVFGTHIDGDVWLHELESREEQKILDNAFNPSYSPDGKRIAFDASIAGPRRIWTSDRLGRNPRQITFDDSEATDQIIPRWSPDGTKIVFQNAEWTTFDIKVVDVSSGEIRSVTNDGYLDLNPAWEHSGKVIYFSSYRSGGLNIWRVPVDARGLPVSPPGQVTTGPGQDVQLAMSDDGSQLAFSILKQNADIWRLPVSPNSGEPTGDPVPVISTTREDSRGAWSPDGSQIAFNSDRSGDMNLWLYSFTDGAVRQLTEGPGGDYQANWSPDGKQLTFFSARAGNNDVWVVDIESGDLERITTKQSMDINPFFSPDGTRIAYQSDLDGRREVWVTGGTGQKRLTNIGVTGHFMRWSPNGDRIVFMSQIGGDAALYEVALDGTPSKPFSVVQGGGAHISFSPDHSLIMDVSGHKVLWLSPTDGKAPSRVFEFDTPEVRIDYPVWSPDGNWVLFDHFEPQGGDIWVMTIVE